MAANWIPLWRSKREPVGYLKRAFRSPKGFEVNTQVKVYAYFLSVMTRQQLLVQFINFCQPLFFSHLITATASIWHTKPVLCSTSRTVNSIKLFKYNPSCKCHGDDHYVSQHVVPNK
jgi:hypothetical protein